MTHVDGSLVPRPSLALVFDHCSPLSQQDRAAGICEPFATFTSLVASFLYLASFPYLASYPYLQVIKNWSRGRPGNEATLMVESWLKVKAWERG